MADEKNKTPVAPTVPRARRRTKKPAAPPAVPGAQPVRRRSTQPVTQAVPPAQRPDFLVSGSTNADLNCRTALLFPASAPLADLAVVGPDRRAVNVAKRKDKSEATTLDLQAVWSHVTQAPEKEAAVFVFLHGHYTYVTIDPAGECALPSWADTDMGGKTTKTEDAKTAAEKAAAPGCLAAGYEVVESIKRYKGSLIALLPENAFPCRVVTDEKGNVTYPSTFPAKHVVNQVGNLSQPDALGKLIDECLQRLTTVKEAAGRPAQCARSPLASVPKIKRLFLAGHSGAHKGLFACARSSITKTVPTDLMLLDCFYHDGTDSVLEFGDNAKGGLGNGPDQSRIILAHNPDSYNKRNKIYASMVAALRKYKDKMKEVEFTRGADRLQTAKSAMTQFPVVAASSTSFNHFRIPPDFIPLVLETAK